MSRLPVKSLRDWVARQSSYRDATHLQEPVDAIRDLQRQAGGNPPPGSLPFEHGYAKIVAAGPGGEADGTNAVYWLQRLMMGPAAWSVPPNLLPDTSEQIDKDSPSNIFPATHLAERYAGSHELATDGTVEVFFWADFDTDDPANKHYLFIADRPGTGSHVALVKITSVLGTGGLYGGVAYDVGSNGDDGAGDYTPPEGQTAGVSVLIENQDEQSQPTHWGIINSYAVGVRQPGMSTEMVPRPVYTIPRGQYVQGLPLVYGDAELDPPAATLTDFESQDASYWDKRDETAPFSGAFSFVILTSIINNYSVDGKVYIKYRPASVDADGRLAYIGQAQNASFGVTS